MPHKGTRPLSRVIKDAHFLAAFLATFLAGLAAFLVTFLGATFLAAGLAAFLAAGLAAFLATFLGATFLATFLAAGFLAATARARAKQSKRNQVSTCVIHQMMLPPRPTFNSDWATFNHCSVAGLRLSLGALLD